MINKAAIFAGAVGGVAPSFLRLIVNYSSPSPQHMIGPPIEYWLAIAGFAVLGAVVVWVFQEMDLKRALYVGIGLPSLLQVGSLQQLTATSPNPYGGAPPSAGPQASISLVSSAYAQEPSPTGSSVTGRTLKLTGGPNAPQYTVFFYGKNNEFVIAKPAAKVVDVPDTAAKFAIHVGESLSPSYGIPETPKAVINVSVQIENAGNGFLQGIGLAKPGQYKITVQIQ